jgi:hypothetical protein
VQVQSERGRETRQRRNPGAYIGGGKKSKKQVRWERDKHRVVEIGDSRGSRKFQKENPLTVLCSYSGLLKT